DFGNAVLSRFAFKTIAHLDLAVGDYEPRGALDVCIETGAQQVLRVVATHLGLRPGERREQVRRLLAAIERDVPHPTVLMGDLNEWFLWGRPLRWLHTHFREEPMAPRTFPAWRPMFALDRIWVSPVGCLRGLAPLRGAGNDSKRPALRSRAANKHYATKAASRARRARVSAVSVTGGAASEALGWRAKQRQSRRCAPCLAHQEKGRRSRAGL